MSEDDPRLQPSLHLQEQLVGAGAPGALITGEGTSVLRAMRSSGHFNGMVKAIYIDPPFNTGEQFEHYDDAMSEEIWLSLLRDSIEIVRDLLHPEGSLWVHLDDRHQHRARCILDEVLGEDAFVSTIIWEKRTSRDARTAFSSVHDYVHVYAPAGPKRWKAIRNPLCDSGVGSNPDNDPRGPWRSAPMTVQDGHATSSQFYVVTTPRGVEHEPPPGRCWTYTAERLAELDADGRVYWPKEGTGKPRLKIFLSEARGLAPLTIWSSEEVGSNAEAKKQLRTVAPNKRLFDTPKPIRLLEQIISISTNPGDLVLDFFLGSGTTAVAASRLGRSWIGVEISPSTVKDFVIPRLQRENAVFDTLEMGRFP